MTPLAQYLLNDWCSPKKDHKVEDHKNVLRCLTEAKCFECSEAMEFTFDLSRKTDGELDFMWESRRIFLPAPVTFLDTNYSIKPNKERADLKSDRVGYLCIEREEKIDVFVCFRFGCYPVGALHSSEAKTNYAGEANKEFFQNASDFLWCVAKLLYLINSPKLLGSRTHLPHAGLQKKIARQMGMTGKFPLHAWTEITLWIDPTGANAEAENAAVEARLSGQKCLHFVRSFLRWRLGQLERVTAHWRGDGSKGIKRSRYNVKSQPVMRPYP